MNADLMIDVLATSRLSRLITDDYVATPIREWMANRGEAMEYLSTCPACTSMYTAVIVRFLPKPVKTVLAFSEITVLLRTAEKIAEGSNWGLSD